MSEYLTIKEVAETLKVSQRTVRNWIKNGLIPAAQFGLQFRIEKTDFENFIKNSQTKGEN